MERGREGGREEGREGGRERERERDHQGVYISILSLINTKLIPPMFGYINYILRIFSWGEWFLVALHLRSTPCRCTFRSSKDPAVSVPGKLSSGLIGQGDSIPVLQPFIYLPINIDMENPQFHTTSRLFFWVTFVCTHVDLLLFTIMYLRVQITMEVDAFTFLMIHQ